MKFEELLRYAKKYSYVVFLNNTIPQGLRTFFLLISFSTFFTTSLFLVLLAVESRLHILPSEFIPLFTMVLPYAQLILGLACITFPFFLFFYSLHTYSRYFILRSIKRIFGDDSHRFLVSYEAAQVILLYEKIGLAHGLLRIPGSLFITRRLLCTPEDIVMYTPHVVVDTNNLILQHNETVTLGSLWKLLYASSDELRQFLLSKKVQQETFYETCDWMDRLIEERKRKSAWWWRENLSKTRGIAKSLSYGGANIISKYARELVMDRDLQEVSNIVLHRESLTLLEEALSKTQGANAVIVGSNGSGRHSLIKILSRMIDQGDCYSEIEHKRVFEFDVTLLSSLDQTTFVSVLDRCFDEAVIDRNIIFVFNDLPTIFDIGQKLGVDVFRIMERYLNHVDISVVCICDQVFYQKESHKIIFDRNFEVIHIDDLNSKLLVPYIQEHALAIEKVTGTFFPAYAIVSIANTLTKYFVEDSPLVKTSDLMYKIATVHTKSGSVILDEETIAEVIKSLTGVSTGEIQANEKEMLLHLEDTLHTKVMGQHEAVKIVASTMRRSRTGLVSAAKPIGSFLFLGPTGVGKTETAKALAQVFFGSEEHMSRIDMNEYTMSNSSYRLLGGSDQEGDITKLIHERPYGVLLLDEFEKATTDVKDLFLRVLDEGVFTNGAGKLISARTQIIIATSNAGSQYIQESGLNAGSTKEEIEVIKNQLLKRIVSEGLFRPELINRFDGVVIFHPLGEDSKILIAKKMLEALRERALTQGYAVTFTDSLVEKLISHERNGVFGGRAIQRSIQSEVEEILARKIIEGNVSVGGSLTLDAQDIE